MRARDGWRGSLTWFQPVCSSPPPPGAVGRDPTGPRLHPAPRTFGFPSSQTQGGGQGRAGGRGGGGGEGGGAARAPPAPPPSGRGGRTRGRVSPQLPAAGSGGRGRGEGTAEGRFTATAAAAGLSQPRKRGGPEGFLVRVKRDMAARPTSPGGPSVNGEGGGASALTAIRWSGGLHFPRGAGGAPKPRV